MKDVCNGSPELQTNFIVHTITRYCNFSNVTTFVLVLCIRAVIHFLLLVNHMLAYTHADEQVCFNSFSQYLQDIL